MCLKAKKILYTNLRQIPLFIYLWYHKINNNIITKINEPHRIREGIYLYNKIEKWKKINLKLN